MTRVVVVLSVTLGVLALGAYILPAWHGQRVNMKLESGLIERVVLPVSSGACTAAIGPHPLVLLALGQSNAGNHGQPDDEESPAVQLVNGSGCVEARDPLPRASGRGGSVWSRLPLHLARAGVTRPVRLSLLAVESSSSDDWTRHGSPSRAELARQARALIHAGMAPDLVLWQQGEADALQGVTSDEYTAHLRQLATDLSGTGIEAPIVLARSTVCSSEPSQAIRSAIEVLTASDRHFVSGPDTDSLQGSLYRQDGCHFSLAGLDAASAKWAKVVADRISTDHH